MTNAIIAIDGKRYIRCCQCTGTGTVPVIAPGQTRDSAYVCMIESPCPNCGGTGLVEIP